MKERPHNHLSENQKKHPNFNVFLVEGIEKYFDGTIRNL